MVSSAAGVSCPRSARQRSVAFALRFCVALTACAPGTEIDAESSQNGSSGSARVGGSGGAQPGGMAAVGGQAAGAEMRAAGSGGSNATSGAADGTDGADDTDGGPLNAAGATGSETSDPSAALYDPANLPRIDLDLPADSLTALGGVSDAEDPLKETYVTAALTYGAETVTNIGLRFKGEGSFQKLDRKPAFKLKFDEFVEDQTFLGLRRMALNNAFEDPSFVAERLAYDLFRAAGLPAPRCNNAVVYVNGIFYGVYVNVEAEDKTFLRRWFASDEGNLYEEGQRDFVPGAEQAFDLETNEALNDKGDLVALVASIQAANSGDSFLQDIGAHLDTAQFLKFTAAEAAVNQWDMYAYTVFYVNNLRIYADPTSNKFSFIPWGMDLSMKPFRDSDKPFIRPFEVARQGDRANGPVSAGLIFQRCLASLACKSAYADAVRQIIDTYEALELEARALSYHEQIRREVLADTRKNICCAPDAALSNEQFEAGFQAVLATIRGRVAALRADLAAP